MFGFIFLHKSDLPEMLNLQEKMVKALPRPDLYFGDLDLIQRCLDTEIGVVGVLDDEKKIIAFHVLDNSPSLEENLGVDLGFSKERLEQVIQIGPICIDPEYQGRGLMAKIISYHIYNNMQINPNKHHILATVSPYNYSSMKYCLTHDFVLKKITTKYNDMIRAIVHRNLDNNTKSSITIRVPNTDIEAQKALISRGFNGYRIEKVSVGFNIIYGI